MQAGCIVLAGSPSLCHSWCKPQLHTPWSQPTQQSEGAQKSTNLKGRKMQGGQNCLRHNFSLPPGLLTLSFNRQLHVPPPRASSVQRGQTAGRLHPPEALADRPAIPGQPDAAVLVRDAA